MIRFLGNDPALFTTRFGRNHKENLRSDAHLSRLFSPREELIGVCSTSIKCLSVRPSVGLRKAESICRVVFLPWDEINQILLDSIL